VLGQGDALEPFGGFRRHRRPARTARTDPDPTWVSTRSAGQRIFLKEGAQAFHTGVIESGKGKRERRARGQTGAATQSHEGVRKGQQPIVNGSYGRLTRERRADEHDDNIDHLGGSHTGAGEADSLLDARQHTGLTEDLSKGCHFSHPTGVEGWDCGVLWTGTVESIIR